MKNFTSCLEARNLYNEGLLTELSNFDRELLETDIGEFGLYEKKKVPLDVPIQVTEKEKTHHLINLKEET